MTAATSKTERPKILAGILALLAGVFLVWAVIEFSSWAVLRTYAAFTSDQRDEDAQTTLNERLGTPLTHPLWAGFYGSGSPSRLTNVYDPFLHHRPAPLSMNDKWLGTDRYGFIHNGDRDRVIDLGSGLITSS